MSHIFYMGGGGGVPLACTFPSACPRLPHQCQFVFVPSVTKMQNNKKESLVGTTCVRKQEKKKCRPSVSPHDLLVLRRRDIGLFP